MNFGRELEGVVMAASHLTVESVYIAICYILVPGLKKKKAAYITNLHAFHCHNNYVNLVIIYH